MILFYCLSSALVRQNLDAWLCYTVCIFPVAVELELPLSTMLFVSIAPQQFMNLRFERLLYLYLKNEFSDSNSGAITCLQRASEMYGITVAIVYAKLCLPVHGFSHSFCNLCTGGLKTLQYCPWWLQLISRSSISHRGRRSEEGLRSWSYSCNLVRHLHHSYPSLLLN